MEPEGSLLCSQEPTISPYPKPYQFGLSYINKTQKTGNQFQNWMKRS